MYEQAELFIEQSLTESNNLTIISKMKTVGYLLIKMIKQSKAFLTCQIDLQSKDYYISYVEQMFQFTHQSDQQKLQSLLSQMASRKADMQEVETLHYYLTDTTRRQLNEVADLLFNKFLTQFLRSTDMTVFIIFVRIVYLRIDQTRQIASKIYELLHKNMLDCCLVYLQLLKWLRCVYQANKMGGFIEYVARDLQKVEQPFLSLYKSELYLNSSFYKRESGRQDGQVLELCQKANQIKNELEFLYDQFRSYYLKGNLQGMILQKEKIFKIKNMLPEMKAYCCAAIGNTLALKGQMHEAIDQIKQALSYNQNSPRIYYQLAKCYFFVQQWSQVCSTIEQFEHDKRIAFQFKGRALAIKGRALFQISKKPDLNATFDSQQKKSQLQKVFTYCSEAIKWHQQNFLAYETLTFLYLEFGNTQAAIQLLEQLSLNRFFKKSQKNQLSILLSYCHYLSNMQQRETPLKKMPQQCIFDCFQYQFLPELIQLYRPELTNTLQQRFQMFKKRQADLFISFGIATRSRNKIDCAIKYFAQALEKQTNNLRAKLQMAECLKLSKKDYSALRYFKQVLEQYESSAKTQIVLKTRLILRNIIELYVQLFTNNNQLELIQVKETLSDAEIFVNTFEKLLCEEQQSITASQHRTIQKIKQILFEKDKINLYFDLFKIYTKNKLPSYAKDIVCQAKRDIYQQKEDTSELEADIYLTFHKARAMVELGLLQQAQKCLIKFWTTCTKNQLQKQFGQLFQESYSLLCSILIDNLRKHKCLDLERFEPFIKIYLIQKYEVLQRIGNLLLEDSQFIAALKYFHQALSLKRNKSIIRKLIEIYSTLLTSQEPLLNSVQHQILIELLDEYDSMIQNSEEYKLLMQACKALKDYNRIQKYYRKLLSQSRATQVLKQISKELSEFYELNGKLEQACRVYAQMLSQASSTQTIQKLQIMIQSYHSTQLTNNRYQEIMLNFLNQESNFVKLLISCRYNQYNTCISFVNEWLKQMKNLSQTELKKEIESKIIQIKKVSPGNSLCALLVQSILYTFLVTVFPSNKTFQNIISINLRPRVFKILGLTKQYFGIEQVTALLAVINQKLDQKNIQLVLGFVLYHNNKMKRKQENQQILRYIKQTSGTIMLEPTIPA